MKNKIIIAIVALASVLFVVSIIFGIDEFSQTHIAGKYGKHCYLKGQEHGNIKLPMKFDNKLDCLSYVNYGKY